MRRLPVESGDGLCYVPALPCVAALSPVHHMQGLHKPLLASCAGAC